MADTQQFDPYQRTAAHIQQPPRSLAKTLRLIGPGMILAASIVGSGELIATTVLGAEVGYSLLWLIIISCLVKIVVQNELGRYSIATGETALEAFDRIPGPRLRVSWMVWCWIIMVLATLMQIGAMMGGIGEVLNREFPEIPILAWVWLLNFATVALLIGGRYAAVERVATGLVVSFTIMTVGCCVILFKLPQYFSWSEVVAGLSFHLPESGIATAVAAFGITGVGATELVMYPYWCIEKGYARYAGPRDDSPEWKERAHGWIRVMGVDVVASMIVYTFATVAFYLLGAGVLNGMGLMPEGSQMVETLSNLYTQTLGDWAMPLFLVGAVAVLYSTVFASTAAHCRAYADFVGIAGLYDRRNYALRLRMIRIFVVLLLFIPSVYFMLVQEPVLMVKIGGIAQAGMLPLIGFATLYLRYKRLPRSTTPPAWITAALWLSAIVMAVIMGYSVIQRATS